VPESEFNVVTAVDNPNLRDENSRIAALAWPEFMLHDPVARFFTELYDYYPQHQFGLADEATGETMCIGNSVPLACGKNLLELPDEGWDWALEKGIKGREEGTTPTVLCAIQVMLPPAHQGKGLSHHAVRVMKEIGRSHGLPTMIAPVRPWLKADYPLTSIDRYITWTTNDGLPFDPWLRVHVRQGGEIIKACPRAMCVSGTIAEWENWTGMRFPESGLYIVPGALTTVSIDYGVDQGIYIEPNVWTVHRAQAFRLS
jgi:hypothetical protein